MTSTIPQATETSHAAGLASSAARSAKSRAGGPGGPRKRHRMAARENRAGYAFLAPWLIGFFALTIGPMAYSLYLSFTRYNIFSDPQWIGFDNYIRLFTQDSVYLQSVQVTAIYVFVGVPIKLMAALGIAMLLNYTTWATGFFRSSFYAPSLIGASVSVAIVWRAMFMTDGPVDSGLSFLGINIGGWVGNVALVLPMMILLAVWQFGAPMVIFLAGLKQVPRELYEAAEVDGAGPWRKFRSVTLPMLSPVIFFNLLLETINAFQVFASAFIISNGSGGPAGQTNFYTLYLYQRAFRDLQLGYASAMAWVLLVVVAIIAFILFRSQKKWVHYAGDDNR
ncbi:carbohydrate ABC transporter membrane protein 1 (CUT1 family) [Microcella alkaliphila]|uniref:Carbohydrate ABC transporter membrane protein 1 (CUT1 family) n=2 Tax=Microcella alkaliphila TaxID=279828 RepID=A0A4Q7TLJ3_9MICO|nr:carbohydrate ABC transporter membrane protein 1 (CUT1 family) [Microcella alkaliphila]